MKADHPLKVALWQFINQYSRTVGGDPVAAPNGKARQLAVAKIEAAIDKIVAEEIANYTADEHR